MTEVLKRLSSDFLGLWSGTCCTRVSFYVDELWGPART